MKQILDKLKKFEQELFDSLLIRFENEDFELNELEQQYMDYSNEKRKWELMLMNKGLFKNSELNR